MRGPASPRLGLAALAIALVSLGAPPGGPSVGRSLANAHYCDGCAPPLTYRGGPVVNTAGASGLTVTPVYWQPEGRAFPDGYVATINGYIRNVAAASGSTDNVVSVATEYHGQGRAPLRYQITAGTPIVDTQPFPKGGCGVTADAYDMCLTDAQLRAELARLVAARGLRGGLATFYPVFFPAGVETEDSDGTNSDDTYCGYHNAFRVRGVTFLYANMPLETYGCDGGQAPNGSVVTDGAISTLSHELLETMTDPVDPAAWLDGSGSEIADICGYNYGSPLGSTDPDDPGHTEYNQVVNGGHYYVQTEFSNGAYKTFGVGHGCQPSSKAAAQHPSQSAERIAFISQPYPNGVPANGTAKVDVFVQAWDRRTQYGITGDTITLSTYVIAGDGSCGTLGRRTGRTDDNGSIEVTYTASRDDVICGIVAIEAKGGKSTTSPVYQGRYRALAATARDTFPAVVRAGATSYFTIVFTNRSARPVPYATVDMEITAAKPSSPNVTARQIRLSTSTRGRGGPFAPLGTFGATQSDSAIQGRFVGPAGRGVTIPAHGTLVLTFRMTVARNVPSRGRTPVLSFEAYLDQLNPATAAGTTLADTLATDARVVR